jgi:hypothetical protein
MMTYHHSQVMAQTKLKRERAKIVKERGFEEEEDATFSPLSTPRTTDEQEKVAAKVQSPMALAAALAPKTEAKAEAAPAVPNWFDDGEEVQTITPGDADMIPAPPPMPSPEGPGAGDAADDEAALPPPLPIAGEDGEMEEGEEEGEVQPPPAPPSDDEEVGGQDGRRTPPEPAQLILALEDTMEYTALATRLTASLERHEQLQLELKRAQYLLQV